MSGLWNKSSVHQVLSFMTGFYLSVCNWLPAHGENFCRSGLCIIWTYVYGVHVKISLGCFKHLDDTMIHFLPVIQTGGMGEGVDVNCLNVDISWSTELISCNLLYCSISGNDDEFSVNDSFTSKLHRVKIQTGIYDLKFEPYLY